MQQVTLSGVLPRRPLLVNRDLQGKVWGPPGEACRVDGRGAASSAHKEPYKRPANGGSGAVGQRKTPGRWPLMANRDLQGKLGTPGEPIGTP
jgi:hypothetical protein